MYPGLEINETLAPIATLEASAPPIILHPDRFDSGGATGVYTVAIRLKTKRGFFSRIAEIEHVEPQPDWLAAMLEKSTSPWLIVVPVVFVIVLGAVALFFVQRHRRMQHSFSRFANTHYNTKTGATRLGDALEDVDDHHEVTPRFTDDDEPLVIT